MSVNPSPAGAFQKRRVRLGSRDELTAMAETDVLRHGLETVTPDVGSPYGWSQRRSVAMVAQGVRSAAEPVDVAKRVDRPWSPRNPCCAIPSGRTRLCCWPPDQGSPTKEWVGLGGLASDEEYVAAMTR